MYHSVTIGTKNTWDDWHLIPASRPLFNPPSVKTNYIEIPGGDGVLDLSTALTGRPTYGNRIGSWDFFIQNGYKSWTALYSEIMSYLHGQSFQAILEDDPAYYYEGRFNVNQWRSDKDCSRIVIDYNVGPYKRDVVGTGTRWLWDPFNFETGVIKSYKNLIVSGSLSIDVIGDMMPVTPIIISTANGMKVTFEGRTYILSCGTNNMKTMVIHSGVNQMVFTGNGKVTIQIMGGRL